MPRLKSLLETLNSKQEELPLEATPEEFRDDKAVAFLKEFGITDVPARLVKDVGEAINQLEYSCRMNHSHLGGAFVTLWTWFEELSGSVQVGELRARVPNGHSEQREYFDPYLDDLSGSNRGILQKNQRNIRKNVMDQAFNNRAGVLLHCIDYANGQRWSAVHADGVWKDVRDQFSEPGYVQLFPKLAAVADFRNKHVGHVEERLSDATAARTSLAEWIRTLIEFERLVKDRFGA